MNAKLITITVPNFPQNYTIFSILTNLFRQKCLKKSIICTYLCLRVMDKCLNYRYMEFS